MIVRFRARVASIRMTGKRARSCRTAPANIADAHPARMDLPIAAEGSGMSKCRQRDRWRTDGFWGDCVRRHLNSRIDVVVRLRFKLLVAISGKFAGGHAMKMMHATLSAMALALAPTSAWAWNARGHMTVAAVAWEKMTPQARSRATVLLRLNPDYSAWIQDIPSSERDKVAFMQAATWPDDLRSRACLSGPDCVRDEGYTPTDASADLNVGYRDKRLRRYWHFKDLPFSTDGTALEQPFAPNAETQIVFFRDSLDDVGVSDEAKSFNLSWLLHLVGDVHQPLHATARFSADSPQGDAGGNGVVVCRPVPATCVTTGRSKDTLHGLWDNAIGTSNTPRSASKKADSLLAQLADNSGFLTRQVAAKDTNALPPVWLEESLSLAKAYTYVDPIGPGKGPYYPTNAYKAAAGSVAEQRITIAGLRLANLLNAQLQ